MRHEIYIYIYGISKKWLSVQTAFRNKHANTFMFEMEWIENKCIQIKLHLNTCQFTNSVFYQRHLQSFCLKLFCKTNVAYNKKTKQNIIALKYNVTQKVRHALKITN